MAKKFAELRAKMTPERRAKNAAATRRMIAELPLQELRNAREFTQVQIARAMGVTQASISKIERNTDMYISTLRQFVAAMGGDVKISAVFPDGEVEIKRFQDLRRSA